MTSRVFVQYKSAINIQSVSMMGVVSTKKYLLTEKCFSNSASQFNNC